MQYIFIVRYTNILKHTNEDSSIPFFPSPASPRKSMSYKNNRESFIR